MIEEAEKVGSLTKEKMIVEPTSGNTGIGIAMVGAVKGIKTCILMPEKMSTEKEITIKGLGSRIIRTPSNIPSNNPQSHFNQARKIISDSPSTTILLDQYNNPVNPKVHYSTTAEEIWSQCSGRLDCVVIGAGTCGTICGISKRLKELNPNVIVVGVDPEGSKISFSKEDFLKEIPAHPYMVEGIGYDFTPAILENSLVDHWERVSDADSFRMARRIIKEEGILCGGSSGSAMVAAIRAAERFKFTSDRRICVILADGVRNYMSKFFSDDWMQIHNLLENCNSSGDVDANVSSTPVEKKSNTDIWLKGKKSHGLNGKSTVKDYIKIISDDEEEGYKAIVNMKNEIIGVIDGRALLRRVINSDIMNRCLEDFMVIEFHTSFYGDDLSKIERNIKTGYPCFINRSGEIRRISMRTLLLYQSQ